MTTGNPRDDQAALWNGPAAQAWVDAEELLDRLYEPLELRLVAEVPEGFAGHVLDVGCGTGGTTVAIARRLGASGRATGVDISDPMIAAARARAERERARATFVSADAQSHPFAAAGVDAVVSRFGVMFFEDPARAFANLRRAASEAAFLRWIVWRSPEENPFMTTAERAAAPLLPSLAPRRGDTPGPFALADPVRVRTLLKAGGWGAIDVQPIDAACVMREDELVFYLTRLGPVGRALADADERTRAQVVETVRPAFDPFVQGAEVRFTAACWMVVARAA